MGRYATQRVNQWLEAQLRELAPGSPLPPDSRIARDLGVSHRTVLRAMSGHRRNGRVVRIPGRGSFLAPGPAAAPGGALDSQAPSHTILAARLLESIGRGAFRRGEALPAQKVLTLQFGVGPKTVAQACRELQARGVVTRVGRRYFVGDFVSLTRGDTRKPVYLLTTERDDFRRAFRDDFLAHAYRRMHHDLSAHGFVLLFDTLGNAPALDTSWRRARRLPYGVVFFRVSREHADEARHAVERLTDVARQLRTTAPRTLIDIHRTPPPGTMPGGVLRRSHMSTAVARRIAAFVAHKGYRRVVFYYDVRVPYDIDSGYSWSSVWPILKLRDELRTTAGEVSFHIVTGNAGRPMDRDRFFRRHMDSIGERAATSILRAYGMRSLWDIAEECTMAPDFRSVYPSEAQPRTLWLFASDRIAADTLDWTTRNAVRVPGDVAIVGLESDLDVLPAGITCVEPDLDTLGYLMAQTIIGDLPVARTSRGYIRTPTIVRERLTT